VTQPAHTALAQEAQRDDLEITEQRLMYEPFIGMRYMLSRSRFSLSVITLISILGVFLGVTALVTVVSVTGGFQETFRDKVLGVNSHVLVMTYAQDNFGEYREVQEFIEENVEGVIGTSPFIFHEMMIASESNLSGILIKGVEPALLDSVSDLPRYILADSDEERQALIEQLHFERYVSSSKKPAPALIGRALAQKLELEVGDTVRVISPRRGIPGESRYGPQQMEPTDRQFRVIGLYDSGFFDYDNRLVIVDYRALQDFFNSPDVVTGVEIKVADIDKTGEIRDYLNSQLNQGPERFRIIDWQDLNHNLFTSLKLQKITLTIIMFFIVLVASFNIVGTLIMMVLDKQKEIAIMKSMGATDGGVMRVFIFQGIFIGGIGTLLGLIGGAVLCEIIATHPFGLDPQVYLIDSLPVRIVLSEFAVVGLSALGISFLATLYPSWWAAQLPPVEGLRYE
jgi:lipoprotein-releasing system permease protein